MRKQSIPNFISKTWEMLDQENNSQIVSWNQEGTGFEVYNQESFAKDLLPLYFKHSNFASFMRQLNMYNFHKRKTASGTLEFNHLLFRKNHKELLVGIKRKPSEADMNQAEQLIKKLAPQCLQDISTDIVKSPSIAKQSFQHSYVPELHLNYYPDLSQLWILTPYMTNAFQSYQYNTENRIKTNIIIQSHDHQNRQNIGFQSDF